jgi:hypothetical protein
MSMSVHADQCLPSVLVRTWIAFGRTSPGGQVTPTSPKFTGAFITPRVRSAMLLRTTCGVRGGKEVTGAALAASTSGRTNASWRNLRTTTPTLHPSPETGQGTC